MKVTSKQFISTFFSVFLVFTIFFFQYTNGCMIYIINDLTTTFTYLIFLKMNVIKKCIQCWCIGNIRKYLTYAYKNTIINDLKNTKRIHYVYLYILHRYYVHYRWYTLRFFQLSHGFVLHIYRGALYIQLVFLNPPFILRETLIIAPWRHDMSCGDTSASWYD